ncbi:retrovirus-related pol polyprotein from transposon TNT 1-94 [Tanacetum coccineum]
MNLKSVENADFQAQIQETILAIETLENELKRIKGKHVIDSVTPKPKAITIALGMFKVAVEPLPPKLFKNKEAHIDYIHKSRENANVLREIVEEVRASNPLDATPKERLIAFTLKNKDSKTKPAYPKPKAITIALGMFKVAVEPLPPKLFKNKEAHIDYIHKSRENANVLREIVEEVRASNPLDGELDLACKYVERIQEELVCVHDTFPCLATPKERLIAFTLKNKDSKTKPTYLVISSQDREKLVDVTPKNKQKKVSFAKPLASSSNSPKQVGSSKTPDSNTPVLPPTGLKSSTKTFVCDENVKRTMLNANSELICVKCNQCMFDANHDACFLKYVSDINVRSKPKSVKKDKTKEEWKPTGHVFTKVGFQWIPTGRKFSLVGNACPLTRITTTKEMPLRKTIPLVVTEQTHVATRIYTRKPNVPIIVGSNRKSKVIQIVMWYLDSGCSKHMTGDRSQLTNFAAKFLGTVKFGNDQIAKITGYGDYQMGNVTISWVYYVEGLRHNLFLVGQFCDSDLEVAFRKHTYFVHNLEGVDLLSGSRGTNLYTISLGDMLSSSPICLLSKASKTKSWLWHRHLSHLNFGAINHLARHGLVRGLPKLKFEKDHLCLACAMGKSKKHSHKPKADDTNQEKLFLLHMDLCGPMHVQSVNGKKYILVIVDDYSRFTWVKFLASKDEAPDFIIKFLKMIQVRLNATVRNIHTDNGTEFVNQTLRDYYESIGISHETSVARTPQQKRVVERRNRTLVEAARTMLIYAKAPLFLWAEAVATACYTQNRSIVRLRHGKTPYELLHDKKPDLSYLHVFGALCYPTNDSENLGKLQAKADIGIFIGYAPKKKAYQIYNRRTRRIIETCHVDFDELTAMASEYSSSEPALHEMTPATLMFDEFFNPLANVNSSVPVDEILIPIVETQAPVESTGSPSSTIVDTDAPSTTTSQTSTQPQFQEIPFGADE